jgi:hypothetical protein
MPAFSSGAIALATALAIICTKKKKNIQIAILVSMEVAVLSRITEKSMARDIQKVP